MRNALSVAMSPSAGGSFAPLFFTGRMPAGLELAASLGFSGVELSCASPDECEPRFCRSRCRELGLEVTAIATGRINYDLGASLADRDPAVRDAAVAMLMALIRLAGELDCPYVIIGGVIGNEPGASARAHEELEETIASTIWRSLLPVCRQAGVTLLLEPINRYERMGLNTVPSLLRLLGRVGEPRSLGLLLDTFHMNLEEVEPGSSVRAAGEWLKYVHVADSNRLVPGMGHFDFAALLRVLTTVGFDGPITLEALPFPDDRTAMEVAARWWANMHTQSRSSSVAHV